MRSFSATTVIIFLFNVITITTSISWAQEYEIADLGEIAEGDVFAYEVNYYNNIVGKSGNTSYQKAFMWKRGHMNELGSGFALGINDNKVIVGGDGVNALLWENGETIVIGRLPDDSRAHAQAINNQRQVAGSSYARGSGDTSAFIWLDGIFTELGTLGGQESYAADINNKSQIVGISDIGGALSYDHGFLWQDGVMTDLGVLNGAEISFANGINDKGDIVGSCITNGEPEIAVLWEGEQITQLEPPYQGKRYRALDINNNGVIIGVTQNASNYDVACVWIDGVAVDLNSYVGGSGWQLRSANAINDRGVITGYGIFNGITRGYIMIPMPELSVNNLVAGEMAIFNVINTWPYNNVYLAYSIYGWGLTPVPALHVDLYLHKPALAASGQSDLEGNISWELFIPPISQGRTLWFQAAEFRRTSNVVESIVQ